MNVLLGVALLFAQAAEPQPAASKLLNDARFANIALRLQGNAELQEAHEGYWAALQARPQWAQQEMLWWQLMQLPDLGPLLLRADEALQKDPKSQGLHDAFYAKLANDGELRRSVEQFERAGFHQHGDIRQWQAALSFFRSNPAQALGFLDGIAEDETLPDALAPFATELMNLRQWEPLRSALTQMGQSPATAEALVPWWNQAVALDAAHGGVFTSLALHFAQHPQRFWGVYRRELELAKEPALRDWVRWWHRRLRREDIDYLEYLVYLQAIREGRETAPAVKEAAWPPEASPAALDALPENMVPKVVPREERARPGVTRPKVERPKKPVRPVQPEPRQSERLRERAAE